MCVGNGAVIGAVFAMVAEHGGLSEAKTGEMLDWLALTADGIHEEQWAQFAKKQDAKDTRDSVSAGEALPSGEAGDSDVGASAGAVP